jgi:hypothetical protein
MTVDAVEDEHVQGVYYILSGHESVKTQYYLFNLSFGYVQFVLFEIKLTFCLLFLFQSFCNFVENVCIILRSLLGLRFFVSFYHFSGRA